MKKNGYKFLCSLFFMLLLMPVMGMTEVKAEPIIGGVDVTTTSNGEGWSYDAATNTLTLTNYVGNSESVHILDVISETINIVLIGDNSITVSGTGVDAAILCKNLVLTGDGTLTVNAPNSRAIDFSGDMTLNGPTLNLSANDVAITGIGHIEVSSGAINVTAAKSGMNVGSMRITNGTVTLRASVSGLSTDEGLVVEGGIIDATVTNPIEGTCGIRPHGGFSVTNGTVIALGGNGIQGAGDVTISGGTVDTTATTNNALDIGALNITGGTTKITGKNYGIIASGQMTISGGKVDITATGENGCPIYAFVGYSIDYDNATVTITGPGYNSNGNSSLGNVATGVVNGQHVAFNVKNAPDGFASAAEETAWNNLLAELADGWNRMGDVDWGETEEDAAKINTTVYAPIIKKLVGMDVPKVYFANLIHIENTSGVDLSAGVPITFAAGGINNGDSVLVLHLKADGTWEVVPATAGNGFITATFTSLSPVYYFKLGTAQVSGDGQHYHHFVDTVVAPTATTWGYTSHGCNECGYHYEDNYVAPLGTVASTNLTSPKTGETYAPTIAIIGAFIAMSGMLICARREYR